MQNLLRSNQQELQSKQATIDAMNARLDALQTHLDRSQEDSSSAAITTSKEIARLQDLVNEIAQERDRLLEVCVLYHVMTCC